MHINSKNIVFDWNSTLLDDIEALHNCTNRVMESVGRNPVDRKTFQHHYEIPFERLYENLGFNPKEIESVLSSTNEAFHAHYEPLAAVTGLREGAEELLSNTKKAGLQNFILSNHIVDPIRFQLRRLGIEQFFTDVLAYADRKTQFRDMTKGERLRRFMKTHDMAPENTVIVGDSLEEIEIAEEQKLISVAITGGCVSEERLQAANPDYLIHSLLALKPILVERGFLS